MKAQFVLFALFVFFIQFSARAAHAVDYAVSGVAHDQTGGLIAGAGIDVGQPGSAAVLSSQTTTRVPSALPFPHPASTS